MKRFLLWIGILLNLNAWSQTTFPLSGRLRDGATKETIIGATVFVVRADSTLAGAAISDDKGRFTIDLERGHYTLKINYIGMESISEELRFYRDTYLGTIDMVPRTSEIDGVEVRTKAPPAQVDGDTVSYSAKAYKTNQNASAGDLVEKMPGVQNVNGEIRAQGEKVQQVLVDGKQFFGQDPKTALSTLPAEVVDKIQIFDDQSEQSKASGIDDGTRIKTMNVVTKINMRNGEFGKVYAGYGTDNRYSAGGNINIFRGEQRLSILGQVNNINQQNFSTEDLLGVVGDNSSGRRHGGRGSRGPGGSRPSFLTGFSAGSSANDFMVSSTGGITSTIAGGLNYQDEWGKKVDVSSSYFYNMGDNVSRTQTYQGYYLPDNAIQDYNENDSSVSTNINHKFTGKLVYKMSPKASLFYIPRVSIQQNSGTSFLVASTMQESAMISLLDQTSNSELTGLSLSNDVMFRLNGEKRGRSLFVEAKHDYSNNSGDRDLYAYNSANSIIDTIQQNGLLNERTNGMTGSIMFSEPLNDSGMGAFFSYDITNTQDRIDNPVYQGLNVLIDSQLTSRYNNDWLSQTVGLGIRNFSRKGGYLVRLKMQRTDLANEQTVPNLEPIERPYFAFLPFAMYRKRFENRAGLFLMYRTYTQAPSAIQLTEAVDNSNPLQISSGNSQLDQQYGHWMMTRFNWSDSKGGRLFYGMINGGFSNNYITQSTTTVMSDTTINGVDLLTGGQYAVPLNMRGQYSTNVFLTYGLPFNKIKSNFNLNLSAGLNRLPSMINDQVNHTSNQNIGLGWVISSNISENIDFTVSSETGYYRSISSLNPSFNSEYLVQNSRVKYDWILQSGFTLRTQLTHQQFFGLSGSLDNSVILWNVGLGKQLFKNKRGELQLSVFDLLSANNSITQNFYSNYYEEINQNVLTRYVMLSFSYNLRKFRESKE